MRKAFGRILNIPLFVFILVATLALTNGVASAFTTSRLIDDKIFDQSASMSGAQIDSWLNTYFPSSCISTNNGFSSPDPVGYNPSQGFLYGGNVSGGTVVAHAAQAYDINPQVLLATLQKESSVVSGDASYHCQYINTSMGYDCPDGGSCPQNPALESGFSKQVIHAAWKFKFNEQRSKGNIGFNIQKPGWNNSDDPGTSYGGPMTQGCYQRNSGDPVICYDGYTTIDGTSTHMDTGGTASLYYYTPHFSGNQNFVTIYTSWFGSPTNVCGSDPSDQIMPPHAHTSGDYNNDGKTDGSVYRPSDNCWHASASGDYLFGQPGDIPVPGDYNNDGKTDGAVYRPNEGGWHIRGVGDFGYGASTDIPVPGDYNGDGKMDAAVYRPSDGTWHIRSVGDYTYGQPGDIPVPGDYNGDGKTDIAIYRPGEGGWHIRAVGDFGYGASSDIPVPGDYNGDGKTDAAIYRPSEGGWHIRAVGDFGYGASTDIPVPGDYNGDGKTDAAVYRPSEGGWHIRAVGDFGYGASSDIPTTQTLNAALLLQYGLISGY